MAAGDKHKKQFGSSSTSYHVSSSGSPSEENNTEDLLSFLEANGFDDMHYNKATSNGICTPEEFMNMSNTKAFGVLGSRSSKAYNHWLSMQVEAEEERRRKEEDENSAAAGWECARREKDRADTLEARNDELQAKNDELQARNDELQNLLREGKLRADELEKKNEKLEYRRHKGKSHASHKTSSSSPTHTPPPVVKGRGRTPGVQADVEDYGGGSRMAANTIDQIDKVLAKRRINEFLEQELGDFADDSVLVSKHGYQLMAYDIMKKIDGLKKGETLNQKFMAAGEITDQDHVRRDGIEVQARIIDSGKHKGKYEVALRLIQQTRRAEKKQTVTSRTSKSTSSSGGNKRWWPFR